MLWGGGGVGGGGDAVAMIWWFPEIINPLTAGAAYIWVFIFY